MLGRNAESIRVISSRTSVRAMAGIIGLNNV